MTGGASRGWHAAFVAAAIIIAALGFLPIANWIPGGHAVPGFQLLLDGWLSGTAICLGVGAVVAIVLRRRGAAAAAAPTAPEEGGADVVSAGIVAAALVLYLVVARMVFSGRPLLIDEIIQVIQARIFASGRLWLPAPAHPEFTSSMHLIDTGKVYGQFPAGGPAMLALGSLVRAEWLVGPVAGARERLGLRTAPSPDRAAPLRAPARARAVRAGAVRGVHERLAHEPRHLADVAAARDRRRCSVRVRDGAPHLRWRRWRADSRWAWRRRSARSMPLAFALPAGLWFLLRSIKRAGALARTRRRPVSGVALPVAALCAINWATTGAPLRFGYTVMWGRSHDLGFHAAPWGDLHTPARGLELLNLYFLRLQSYLFETPFPALLPAIAWLGLGREHDRADRFFLVSGTLLCLLYAAYWHDGFYLGPRFLFALAPALALWSARAVTIPVGNPLARRALASPSSRAC